MKKAIIFTSIVSVIILGGWVAYLSPISSKDQSKGGDALWIYIHGPLRDPKQDSHFYFDIENDGSFLVIIAHSKWWLKEVRFGKLSQNVIDKAFAVVNTSSVLYASDKDPGEPLFSSDRWVNVGVITNQKVIPASPWGFQEEFRDFSEEFQQSVSDLESAVEATKPIKEINTVLWASEVDPQRAKRIEKDPRGFYNIIAMNKEELKKVTSLGDAIRMPSRLIPIKNEGGLQKIKRYILQSNPKRPTKAMEFFIRFSGDVYQLHLLKIQ